VDALTPCNGGDDLPAVNVALGGGGAKGFAHAGVLQAIAEHFTIESIVGTSMGAIVGALYAHLYAQRYVTRSESTVRERQRKAALAVEQVLKAQNFLLFLDPSLSPLTAGIVHGRRIARWLRNQLCTSTGQDMLFADLPFDLTITATANATGEMLPLNRSSAPALSIADAVRASMSIPFLFAPVTIDYGGQRITCWDGGITGNCRFDLAHRAHPSRLTIASSLTYRGEHTTPSTGVFRPFLRYFRDMNHSADILLRQLEIVTAEALGPQVMRNILLVRPPLGSTRSLTFNLSRARIAELIRRARVETQDAIKPHVSYVL